MFQNWPLLLGEYSVRDLSRSSALERRYRFDLEIFRKAGPIVYTETYSPVLRDTVYATKMETLSDPHIVSTLSPRTQYTIIHRLRKKFYG